MFRYIKSSFKRKIARRITKEYPARIDNYDVEELGTIEFANWTNPLVPNVLFSNEMTAFFHQFIKRGDMVIDIGANIGDTTVPMALCAGREGITLAFDPNPYVFKILEVNAGLNKTLTNIHPYPFAITCKKEDFHFISSEASFGNGGISCSKESHHGKFIYPQMIRGVNLKEFLEEKYSSQIQSLSFIKIDAEGYDKEILKSISDLVKKYQPSIIAESFGPAKDADKMELYEVFEKMNYEIFYFEDFVPGTQIVRLNNKNDMLKWKNTINVLAKPCL